MTWTSFPVVIQINAIDTIHILMVDVLAHTREDGPSQVAVVHIKQFIILIFINWIPQGAFALDHHREDRFLVDDSHIKGLLSLGVLRFMGLYNLIEQFLQCHIHSHAVRQFACLYKGAHLGQKRLDSLGSIRHGENDGRIRRNRVLQCGPGIKTMDSSPLPL